MKILVTGGAGFIGSHLVDRLVEIGERVIVVDKLSKGKEKNLNPLARYYKLSLDASEVEEIFKEGIDLVIHLAAQVSVRKSADDPLSDAQNNIIVGLKLLEYCRKYKVEKIIYANSAAEIGNPIYLPVDEKHPAQPLSPYGLSKKTFAEYLKIYRRLYGLNYTSLRFANVYGPRQEGSKECGVVPIFITKLLREIPVTIIGDGQQSRDFVYVGDVVEAIIAVLGEKGNGEQYNIGSGKETFINDLFQLIKELVGSGLPPSYRAARRGELQRCVFNIDKAEREIGWQSETSLREGLMKTINHLKKEEKKKMKQNEKYY